MKDRFIAFLKQGLSPERLSLCVSLGIIVGVFPVLGSTTLLCALVALALRLNLAAIQSVNYVVYPLQLILLIPFYRLGEKLFRVQPIGLSIEEVKAIFKQGIPHAVRVLWDTTMHAMVVWCLLAPLALAMLYPLFLILFRSLARKSQANQ